MEPCQGRHMGKKQHPPSIRRFVQHLQKMPQGFYGKPVAFSPFRVKGIQKNHPQPLFRIVCTIIRVISAKAKLRAGFKGKPLGIAAEEIPVMVAQTAKKR